MEINSEYIKNILKHFEKIEKYYEKLNKANERNNKEIGDLVDFVNKILSENNISDRITSDHIKFDAQYIGNIDLTDKKLSDIIFDKIYPKPKRKTFSHFTSSYAALNIIDNKEFWLFNLLKNYKDEEFRLFYEEHNIDGYKNYSNTFGIETDYVHLMSEIFSLSFTSEENKSSQLWKYFGKNETGVKLTFEINSKIPDFREVYYSNRNTKEPIKLIIDLINKVQEKFKSPFIFSYISKIGAYYIKGNFDNEKEYRFMIKRTSDCYNAYGFTPVPFGDGISYIKLPFSSDFADFKLVKVEKGKRCSESDFYKIKNVIKNKYKDVEIIE